MSLPWGVLRQQEAQGMEGLGACLLPSSREVDPLPEHCQAPRLLQNSPLQETGAVSLCQAVQRWLGHQPSCSDHVCTW